MIEPRSEIRVSEPLRPGNGTSRHWRRVMNGKLYRFTAVTMPSGERRYSAHRHDGRPIVNGRGVFDCEWTRLHLCIRIPAPHVDYPHEPGRLYDCAACEAGPCVCDPSTDAPCVSSQCTQQTEG